MKRRPARRTIERARRRRLTLHGDVDYSSKKPPSWYEKHGDKNPCECPVDAERLKTATRYSDFGYILNRCPSCEKKWAFHIEG